MNDFSSTPHSLNEDAARELDRVCDQFEQLWVADPNHPPRLEDFLPTSDANARAVYFRELSALEMHYRQSHRVASANEVDSQTVLELPNGAAPLSLAAGTTIHVPGYEIDKLLGRGAMGVVYLARQVRLRREVALKVLLTGLPVDDGEKSRFRTETDAVARLNHAGIVQVYDAGECGTLGDTVVPYLAMEYCPGGSLAARLAGNPLPSLEAAHLVEQLARAMHVAHAAQVVHRDLKPSNVLLDAAGRPKVADFGLAKLLDDVSRTHSGALLGTPAYMAPEQAAGNAGTVGPAADVYALGAILYECLTGRAPFKAPSVAETLEQVRTHEPVPVRQLQSGTPLDLETITLKCLRKESERRYATAAELADDLTAFREGRPIRARPVSVVEKSWRWGRRHPALAGLYAVSLLAVLLLAFGVWFSSRLETAEARLEAESARTEAARTREQAARTEADAQRFVGLTGQLRARIARPTPGWTWEALAEIQQAAQLPGAADNLVELRSDAVECLTGLDVRPVRTLGEGLSVSKVAWSPDGKWLAIGQRGTNIIALSCYVTLVSPDAALPPRTLAAPRKFVTGSSGPTVDVISALAFSPDGRWLAAGSRSGWLHCWDLTRDEALAWSAEGHAKGVSGLAFSRDGLSVYSAGGQTVRRLETSTGNTLATFTANANLGELRLHPSEGWVAVVSEQLYRLNAITLQPLGRPLPFSCNPFVFTPDGACLLGTRPGRVLTWYLEGREEVRALTSPRSSAQEMSDGIALDPGGTLLLTASSTRQDRQVRLWDLVAGRVVAQWPYEGEVGMVAFAPDGRRFVVTGAKVVQLFEVGGLREQTVVALHHENPIREFNLSGDGRGLVCAARPVHDGWHRELSTWATAGGNRRHRLSLQVQPGASLKLSATPDAAEVAHVAQTDQGQLRYWHLDSAEQRNGGKANSVRQLEHDSQGRLWAVAGDEAIVWDARGERLASFGRPNWMATALTGKPGLLAIAPGQRLTAVVNRDGSLLLLELRDGVLRSLANPLLSKSELTTVALAADETVALAGSATGEVIVTDVPGGAKRLVLSAHQDAVSAIRSADNGLWASGDRRGLVRVWCWQGKQPQELLTLRHTDPVRELRFHPDGVRLFVLLEGEHAVRVYHLDQLRARLETLGLGAGLSAIEKRPSPPDLPAEQPSVRPRLKSSRGLRLELFRTPYWQGFFGWYDRQLAEVFWQELATHKVPVVPPFSTRLSGWLRAPKPGRYSLSLVGKQRCRLWLDEVLLAESEGTPVAVEVALTARPHRLRIEQVSWDDTGAARLTWNEAGVTPLLPVAGAFLYSDSKVAERTAMPPGFHRVDEVGHLPEVDDGADALTFSKDGQQLACGVSRKGRGVVFVRDATGRTERLPVGVATKAWQDFSGDLRLGLYRSAAGELKVRDLLRQDDVQKLSVPGLNLTGGWFAPAGKDAVAAIGDGLWVWEVGQAKPRWSVAPLRLRDVAWSPGGNKVYFCRATPQLSKIEARDATDGRLLGEVELPGDGWEKAIVRMSSNGRWLAVSDAGNRLALVDVVKYRLVRSWLTDYERGQLRDLVVMPDNRLIVTVGGGGGRVWDLLGKNVACFGELDGTQHRVAAAPDAQTFVTGSRDAGKRVRLWRITSPDRAVAPPP